MIRRYELDNGQIFSEAGALKDDGSQYVKGAYSFQGDDGETYWVNYTADEEGFHPVVGEFFFIFCHWIYSFETKRERHWSIKFNLIWIGSGPGGIGAGQDAEIDPNALKSLVG